jgi:predicted amidohydrolase YtcJ
VRRVSLAWREDRIVAIGPDDEVSRRVGPEARRVDLEGALVLPGLWDCHTHMLYGALQGARLDLRNIKSKEELRRAIAQWIRANPQEPWIVGAGWDETSWGGELPKKEWVDDITGSRPLFLIRYDMHSALANSRALQMAGIGRDTEDPPGGKIVRDPDGGEPTGWLLERAMELVERLIPEVAHERKAKLLEKALEEASRLGLVGLNDILFDIEDIEIYGTVYAGARDLPRVFLTIPMEELSRFALVQERELPDGVKVYGLKAFLDGSLGSRSAWMREPYLDRGDYKGVSWISDWKGFKELVLEAARSNIPISLHAIGDEAIARALEVYWEVIRGGMGKGPLRIEHFQHPSPHQIGAMDHPRLVASMQPIHMRFDAPIAEQALGPQRARWSFPIGSLLGRKCAVVFGSDWPVAPLDPLQGIQAAVERVDQDMRWPNGWIPEERIGIVEAIECYTRNSTRVMGMKEAGELREGFLADLTVVEDDITACEPRAISQSRVLMTVVGGKVVYGEI